MTIPFAAILELLGQPAPRNVAADQNAVGRPARLNELPHVAQELATVVGVIVPSVAVATEVDAGEMEQTSRRVGMSLLLNAADGRTDLSGRAVGSSKV